MWLEKILCMISVFKFIKFWGGWNMVCFVGNAMWTWEECTFYSFLIEYIINIYYIKLINSEFLVKCILSYILPAGPFSYWSRVVKVSNHNSRFLVASHLFLSLVFQDSIIRYMHVKIVMSLKKKRLLCLFGELSPSLLCIPLFISDNFPCSKVCCAWN